MKGMTMDATVQTRAALDRRRPKPRGWRTYLGFLDRRMRRLDRRARPPANAIVMPAPNPPDLLDQAAWGVNERERERQEREVARSPCERGHLRADQLLPGDVIEAEGMRLTVEQVHPTPNLVILDFADLPEYGVTYRRDERVHTVSRVDRYSPTHR